MRGKFFCSAESEYSAQCSPGMSVLQMDIFVFELAYVIYILAFLTQIESFHKLHIKPNKMASPMEKYSLTGDLLLGSGREAGTF